MNRPRLLRGLRIAWTAVWGILCVLLVMLWVRSYSWIDIVPYKRLTSAKGRVYVNQVLNCPEGIRNEWIYPSGYWKMPFDGQSVVPTGPKGFSMPYSSFVALGLVVAAAPWIGWSKRFSLRTMFIATTLIAVLLGLVVWATG